MFSQKNAGIVNRIEAGSDLVPPEGITMMLESEAVSAQIPWAEKLVNPLDVGYVVGAEKFLLDIGDSVRGHFTDAWLGSGGFGLWGY